jgi:TonB-dependent receptor-like protein
MGRNRCTSPAWMLLAVAVLPLVTSAQRPPPPNTVSINVTVVSAVTRAPIAGAILRLRTVQGAAAVTDSLGRAAFVGVPKRIEGLEATHLEFESRTQVLPLDEGDFDEVSVTLPLKPRDAARLRTVAVTAEAPSKAPGLEARRTIGRGHFIGRQEIDKIKPRATTELLRRVPGLRVETAGSQVGIRSRRAGDCEMLLYLDGTPVYNELAPGTRRSRGATAVVSVIDRIPPTMLEAIEVYLGPAETPPQYSRGGANCGAILIWTRAAR